MDIFFSKLHLLHDEHHCEKEDLAPDTLSELQALLYSQNVYKMNQCNASNAMPLYLIAEQVQIEAKLN